MKDNRFKVPVSVQLILQKGNSVLLLRRFNTGYADGHYCLPAGHVEENEEAKTAMIREAKEEIDIEVIQDDLELVHVIHRKAVGITYIDFIFKAKKWSGEIKIMEPNKCDELIWADLNDLPDKIIPFTKKLVRTKEMYIPYGWNETEQKLDEEQNMNSDTAIKLVRASEIDAEEIFNMQRISFRELFEKYQDFDTNPRNDTLEKIISKLKRNNTEYYFMQYDRKNVGVVYIKQLANDIMNLTTLFVLPEYRGRGYAQIAIKKIEELHSEIKEWQLDTVLQEKGNCYLYEKMGYKKTEETKHIKEGMDLVYYKKIM